MSALVLYAVVPAVRLPPAAGATVVGHAGLATLAEGSVAVVYAERDRAPARTREEMLGFARVVQDLATDGPVLPVRFGTVLDDLEGLRRLLREREAQWQARLSHVAGHVELLVHAYDDRAPRPSSPSRGTGRDYLLSRAAAQRHAEAMHAELLEELAAHCREVRRLPATGEVRRLPATGEVRVACLVASDGIGKLRRGAESWAEAREGRRTTVTGPWPPFSFAEEDPS